MLSLYSNHIKYDFINLTVLFSHTESFYLYGFELFKEYIQNIPGVEQMFIKWTSGAAEDLSDPALPKTITKSDKIYVKM